MDLKQIRKIEIAVTIDTKHHEVARRMAQEIDLMDLGGPPATGWSLAFEPELQLRPRVVAYATGLQATELL